MRTGILIFGNYPPPFGGIPSHIESLCLSLVENGWVAHVVSGGKGGVAINSGFAVHKLSAYRVLLSPSRPFRTIRLLLRRPFVRLLPSHWRIWIRYFIYISIGRSIIRRNRIDLISAYNLISYGAVAAVLSREYSIPLVVTNFGEIYSKRSFFSKHVDIVDHISGTARKLMAMSTHCANSYHLLDRYPEVTVIPYGVDTQKFNTTIDRDAARHKLGITGNDPIILLYLGRMNRDMGLHVFLQAIPELLKRDESLRIVIAGERGELTPGANKMSNDFKDRILVEERVPYSGLEEYYAVASIVVVPTIGDRACGSLSSIEAMACGKAVIGSRAGGIPEIVQDGKTGILIPPKDPIALSWAVWELSRHESLMNRMGALGRQRAVSHFSQSTANAKIENVFQAVCGS